MNNGTAVTVPGPKSTPTFADGRLFTLGMTQHVTALDAAIGQRALAEAGRRCSRTFTRRCRRLWIGGMMILHVGGHNDGALTAFDPATGKVIWNWTGDGPGLWLADHRRDRRRAPGRRLLSEESRWRERGQRPAAVERAVRSALDDELDYAAGVRRQHAHRVGAGQAADGVHHREQGRKWAADLAWENPQMSMSFSNAVLVGDALFSMSPLNSGQFFWADAKIGQDAVALGAASGRQRGDYALGRSAVRAERRRELMVGKATPGAAFVPVKTYTVATSATWAPPVISGNRIFVKDVDTLALWTLN